MNPQDVIINPQAINVAGVVFSNAHVYDKLNELAAAFPIGLNISPTDSTLDALIKCVTGTSGASTYSGGLINSCAQVMQDVAFASDDAYSAGLCVSPGTEVFNIFTTDAGEIGTNPLLKHIGANVVLTYTGVNQLTGAPFNFAYNKILTAESDVGTYGLLAITSDGDPMENPADTNLYRGVRFGFQLLLSPRKEPHPIRNFPT
jgi:hypothetical protein